MARCASCHRRLKTGRSCPQHGGAIASEASAPVESPPMWTEPIGDRVGAGGFASVWELGAGRVLKVAHASHALAHARLGREAEALAAIGPPAVPRLDASGVLADGRPFIAMARVAGATFAELTTLGPMRVADAIALGVATLDALARVHAAGFVHRDVKPDNLVRLADGSVAILDLGLARKLPVDADDPTRASVQVGSLEYIAPEQLVDSGAVDVRADLYAFGCVLFELVAGRPPFVGDAAALERAHAALRPPRLATLVAASAAVDTIVADCLAKDRERRPSSADALRDRLVAVRDEPTGRRVQPSVSVIREGKQPVVLLWAELPRVDRALLGLLTGRRLVVSSQRGRRVLAGVLGAEHADPASVAIAAARDLAAEGARVALHLEALRVDADRKLHGDAVERPEGWLPAPSWRGVVVSRALASVVQTPTRRSELGDDFVALADDAAPTELFGRDALLVDLAADAAAALRGTGPAFALLYGDAGVGKSAFASELARRIGELGVRTCVATIPAPGTGLGAPRALAEALGVPIAVTDRASIVRAIGDALRGAARTEPLALILDDLHHAEHELLDALDYATLGGEPLALWLLGVAAPRLDTRRPNLGARAERRRRDVLRPLDDDAAIALTAALLRPAEYPPLRALRRLVAIAHGNPLHLVMLAREIRERGAIRARAGGGHFLDTSALDELQPIALGPWLAARELGGLSAELVALARLCAVLGAEVRRDELVAVVDAVERRGGATTTIDVDVGLDELARAGVVVASERGWTFAQALVEEGVYATTHDAERAALHEAALDYWRAGSLADPAVAERVARHAEAIGARPTAAAAYAALAGWAEREHHPLDADQAWSGAERNLDGDDERRARALLGRARARYRQQRIRDALADLEQALAVATALGDARLELEVRLEQATAFDWNDDFARSAEVARRARELFATVDAPDLELDIELAEARGAWRARQFETAVELLRAVRGKAATTGRAELEVIAGLMLGTTLVDLGRLDEGEAVFAELIALCGRIGDRVHLGMAHANRSWLWSARGDLDRCAEDLNVVMQLARELGAATLERIATYNLAEAWLWHGKLDAALQLARRSLALQLGHGEGAAQWDRLLVARILAARGDVADLASLLDQLRRGELAEEDLVIVELLQCVADAAPLERWAEALRASRGLGADVRLELARLAARFARIPADLVDDLRQLRAAHAIWSRRPAEP